MSIKFMFLEQPKMGETFCAIIALVVADR